jgi:hypothetical protein
MLTVSWFSAGVSSAVATKLVIDKIDRIIYTHIEDQHPDTMRFIRDCEQWFGKPVEILIPQYKTVDDVQRAVSFVNSKNGAPCTRILKVRTRKRWEREQADSLRYVWGIDYGERKRCEKLLRAMPSQDHLFPLVDAKITKKRAHQILQASGIKRPAMYELGYHNNNCIGCAKGGKGYWNKIRIDFPETFKLRAETERLIGASSINGTFLDKLNPNAGRKQGPIVGDCGIFCELDLL